MAKKAIGFSAVDEIAVTKEKKEPSMKHKLGVIIMAVAAPLFIISVGDKLFGSDAPKETPKQETRVEETKKSMPPGTETPSKPYKAEGPITGIEAVHKHGDELVSIFNSEINSMKENKIFKSNFAIKDAYTLVMTVNVENVVTTTGVTKENAIAGIKQGSPAYKPYLDRFNNRIWNGKGQNLKLQITDEYGTVLIEVTQ